jgi:hypothetical protein
LSELLPVLQEGLHSSDPVHVQGICIALVEVMDSASKDSLETFQDILTQSVREALLLPYPEVQNAAAESFQALQQQFPTKAIESIIPSLLRQLESETPSESEIALVALREIMKSRANTRVLGSLIPSLTSVPISPVNAKALSSLAEAAGEGIYSRLSSILQSIMDSLLQVKDQSWLDALSKSFKVIALSVDEEEGIRIVLTTLFSGLRVCLSSSQLICSMKIPGDENLRLFKQALSSRIRTRTFLDMLANGQLHWLVRSQNEIQQSYKVQFSLSVH